MSFFSRKQDAAPSIDPARLPHHIAVIMDGNGRWARARGLPRTAGHRKGVEATRALIEEAARMGIAQVTLYAFSSENWDRPAEEVQELMELLRQYLTRERSYFLEQKARLRVIGDRSRLAPDIVAQIVEMEAATLPQARMVVNVALSYGGRQELVAAVQRIMAEAPATVTEATIQNALYAHDMPDPDLLIRTGGDHRISNFLLWQMAYTELYFTDVLWPDFNATALSAAIVDFQGRQRRFGKTGEQVVRAVEPQ